MLKHLVVFDFDDTLVYTPTPEEGIPVYEKETGKPWIIKDSETAQAHGFPSKFRRKGWWGRKETLEPPIFNPTIDNFNKEVVKVFYDLRNRPDTYIVIMTGRMYHSEKRVKEILNPYNITADEYFFQGQYNLVNHPKYPKIRDTFAYKSFVVNYKLMRPEFEIVEIFDDREEHMPKFLDLGKELKTAWHNLQSVKINDVRQNKEYIV